MLEAVKLLERVFTVPLILPDDPDSPTNTEVCMYISCIEPYCLVPSLVTFISALMYIPGTLPLSKYRELTLYYIMLLSPPSPSLHNCTATAQPPPWRVGWRALVWPTTSPSSIKRASAKHSRPSLSLTMSVHLPLSALSLPLSSLHSVFLSRT